MNSITDNETFKRTVRVIFLHMNDGAPPGKLGFFSRRIVKAATRELEGLLSCWPNNWRLLWVLGKAYQVLGDPNQCYAYFKQSVEHCDERNPDVYREASIQAFTLGFGVEAERWAVAAIKIKPGDAGLIANLAVSQIIQQKLIEADQSIARALELQPEDKVSIRIRCLIDSIQAGEVDCPSRFK